MTARQQRLTTSLIPLDAALTALLDGLEPIAPSELPIAETLGSVSAEVPLPCPFPMSDFAVFDGWAFCARDLVGASSYSPLPLARLPSQPMLLAQAVALSSYPPSTLLPLYRFRALCWPNLLL